MYKKEKLVTCPYVVEFCVKLLRICLVLLQDKIEVCPQNFVPRFAPDADTCLTARLDCENSCCLVSVVLCCHVDICFAYRFLGNSCSGSKFPRLNLEYLCSAIDHGDGKPGRH